MAQRTELKFGDLIIMLKHYIHLMLTHLWGSKHSNSNSNSVLIRIHLRTPQTDLVVTTLGLWAPQVSRSPIFSRLLSQALLQRNKSTQLVVEALVVSHPQPALTISVRRCSTHFSL